MSPALLIWKLMYVTVIVFTFELQYIQLATWVANEELSSETEHFDNTEFTNYIEPAFSSRIHNVSQ